MQIITAFMIVFIVYAIGDILATKTKGLVSSTLFCFLFFMIGFWTFLPKTIFTDSGLMAISTPTLFLLMVNMGTTIKLQDFVLQWKTILIAFPLGAILCLAPVLIAPLFIDKLYAYIAGPILTGGVPAALIMQGAAESLERADLGVFAIVILAFQNIVGIPIASACLKRESQKLLLDFHSGQSVTNGLSNIQTNVKERKRLIPPIPSKYLSDNVIIAKMCFVAFLAFQIYTTVTHGVINGMIASLVLGLLFKELGFLEESSLSKCNGSVFVAGACMVSVFASSGNATPQMVLNQLIPLLVILCIAIIAMALLALGLSKIFKCSWYIAMAIGSSSLFGFPITLMVANEVANNAGKTDEEKLYLQKILQPKMVVAGIITVTLSSVAFASIMAQLI